jgi:hypothetical protein
LPGKLLLELLQGIPEKLVAIQRLLGQQPCPGSQAYPAANPLLPLGGPPGPGAFTATVEGDPASDSFYIHFLRASRGSEAPPPDSPPPGPETLSIAAKVFHLLSAVSPDSRQRKAPPLMVFLLRFRQNLSVAEIAHECKCGTSLVSLRLRTIQRKLPWQPEQLRELSAQVEAMQDALDDSRAREIYRKGAAYGSQEEEPGLE